MGWRGRGLVCDYRRQVNPIAQVGNGRCRSSPESLGSIADIIHNYTCTYYMYMYASIQPSDYCQVKVQNPDFGTLQCPRCATIAGL